MVFENEISVATGKLVSARSTRHIVIDRFRSAFASDDFVYGWQFGHVKELPAILRPHALVSSQALR
jgi:hypothetical protein